MLGVFAQNAHDAFAPYDFALIAHLLYTRSNLHLVISPAAGPAAQARRKADLRARTVIIPTKALLFVKQNLQFRIRRRASHDDRDRLAY